MKKAAIGILIFMGVASKVEAATFSYIFNNVEQGDNGTANPSIVVDGEKVTKVPGDGKTPVILSSQEQNVPSVGNPALPFKYRLMLLGNQLSRSQDGGTGYSAIREDLKEGTSKEKRNKSNLSLAGSIYLTKNLAATGFWARNRSSGGYWGGELEYTPIRLEVLGASDFVELGILAGGSSMAKDTINKTVVMHAGIRASVNIFKHLGITSAIRSNITDRKLSRYTMAEAGLAYRF